MEDFFEILTIFGPKSPSPPPGSICVPDLVKVCEGFINIDPHSLLLVLHEWHVGACYIQAKDQHKEHVRVILISTLTHTFRGPLKLVHEVIFVSPKEVTH